MSHDRPFIMYFVLNWLRVLSHKLADIKVVTLHIFDLSINNFAKVQDGSVGRRNLYYNDQ